MSRPPRTPAEVEALLKEIGAQGPIRHYQLVQAGIQASVHKHFGGIKRACQIFGLNYLKRNGKNGIDTDDTYKVNFTERICLKCHKPFQSTGKSNRLCLSCRVINSGYDALAEGMPR